MKNVILILLALLSCSDAIAQHTSEDFKDGTGCGPFPLYLTLGGALSGYRDFRTIGNRFASVYDADKKTWMRGVEASFGSPIIGKRRMVKLLPKFLSFAMEGKFLVLQRQVSSEGQKFEMASHQLSVGAGIRWAVFPIVLQAQYQRILFSKQTYNLRLAGVEKSFDHTSQGNMFLARFSFLDPAGSDGGFGIFAEYGINLLERSRNNNALTAVMTEINGSPGTNLNAARSYRFFSAGIIVPLALRIN